MHYTTPKFWERYDRLAPEVQSLADKNYELLKIDPAHPSLHFKKAGRYWSVRVGRDYRAVGVEASEGIVWFWIGTHREYDRLIGAK
ncbi:MAG: hypothetical protein U1D97_02445 [Desulfuromonadales bacterium]|nr:hypothetical protein [Desulfuromonadales bacterium]